MGENFQDHSSLLISILFDNPEGFDRMQLFQPQPPPSAISKLIYGNYSCPQVDCAVEVLVCISGLSDCLGEPSPSPGIMTCFMDVDDNGKYVMNNPEMPKLQVHVLGVPARLGDGTWPADSFFASISGSWTNVSQN